MQDDYWVSGVHKFIDSQNSVEIRKTIETRIVIESRKYGDLDLKIDIFENRTRCWFLNHVKYLSELEKNPTNGDHTTPGDYAAIVLACSQLEGFEKYRDGIDHDRNGKHYFKKALKKIFFDRAKKQAENKNDDDEVLTFLYNSLRSGSFHAGFPDGKIYLDRDSASIIDVVRTSDGKKIDYIIVNPVKFVDALFAYFHKYVFDLQNTDNRDLRVNFQKRWDCLWENS